MSGYRRSVSYRRWVVRPESLWELLNLGAPDETAWMRDGLCAQTAPDVFFPDKGDPVTEDIRLAKATCARCPVLADCHTYALIHDERFGVWGGTTPNERRELRRAADGVAA